jgi:hypothetical protein
MKASMGVWQSSAAQRDQLRRFLRNAAPLIEPGHRYEVGWQFHVKRLHVFYPSAPGSLGRQTSSSRSCMCQRVSPR